MATQASNNVGAGQQDPDDSNSDFSVAAFLIRQFIAEMETMTPVQVHTVHAGSGSPPVAGTVDVQLLVSLLDGAGNQVKQGIVYGLPYFRLQGGPWAIVCDPAANDFGFIISASRDISNIVNKPSQQVPGSYRQHSFSDGIYVGGCLNAVPRATLWLKSDGTFKLADQAGLVLQSDGSGGMKMTGNLAVIGNVTATGTITAGFGGGDQVGLQTHTHGGVQTGSGTTLSPTPGT